MVNAEKRVVGIIQARIDSSRLPAKIMLDLAGQPVLRRVIQRVKASNYIHDICVATSEEKTDDLVERACLYWKVTSYRGSKNNVLNRFFHAAKLMDSDIVVRFTADNPLVDCRLVDECIKHILANQDLQYVTTERDEIPYGSFAEVFTFDALKEANKKAKTAYEKEHVTPYMVDNKNGMKTYYLEPPAFLKRPDLRLSIDTLDDYLRVQRIFCNFISMNAVEIKIEDIKSVL